MFYKIGRAVVVALTVAPTVTGEYNGSSLPLLGYCPRLGYRLTITILF